MDKKRLTIEQLRLMRESEDHVEFKRCQQGNLSFNGADKQKPSDLEKPDQTGTERRRSLGHF